MMYFCLRQFVQVALSFCKALVLAPHSYVAAYPLMLLTLLPTLPEPFCLIHVLFMTTLTTFMYS